MDFLSIVKNISKNVDYYNKTYFPPFSKGNMTNPFLPKKQYLTIIWIDKNKE